MTSTLLVALTLVMLFGHVYAARISATSLGLAVSVRRSSTLRVEVVVTALLSLSAILVHTGIFTHFNSRPPYILRYIALHIILAIVVGLSPYGRRLAMGLPIAILVGFQSFRIFVELLLHQYYRFGLLPVQMTYNGRNLDILSGITAAVVALLALRGFAPLWLLYVWSFLGLGLLINVIVIAFLSAPGPLRYFHNDPANTLFATWPGIWVPTFLAPTALLGHVVLFRRLISDSRIAKANL